jgi:hypothetical protein
MSVNLVRARLQWSRPAKHLASFASVFFLVLAAKSQILSNEFLLHRYPTFEAAEVAKEGIKSITIREMQKPSSRPIYDYSIRFTYFFDRQGRLIGYRKTYPGYGGRIDTNEVKRIYFQNQLAQETERMGSYQRKTVYAPLASNTQKRTISTRIGKAPWEKISLEKIEHQEIKGGFVKLIGGIRSEPYQRIVCMQNEQDNLVVRETWNGSRIQNLEMWEYSSSIPTYYRFKDVSQNAVFEYRFPSNDSAEGSFCVKGKCKKWSIVRHENGWPKGWILMDPVSQDAEIWEFVYRRW